MVAHGQDVGQHLGRVPLVGEPVPHRHTGEARQVLDVVLGEAPVLDAVEHPAEDPGRVLHRLLVAELGLVRARGR